MKQYCYAVKINVLVSVFYKKQKTKQKLLHVLILRLFQPQAFRSSIFVYLLIMTFSFTSKVLQIGSDTMFDLSKAYFMRG